MMPELWHCCVYLSLAKIKMRFPDAVAPEIDGLERGGVRKIGKGSGEAREGGMRIQGNGGQRRGLYEPPPSLFFIPVANEAV